MSRSGLKKTATLEALIELNRSLRGQAVELLLSIAALKDQLDRRTSLPPSKKRRDKDNGNTKRESKRCARPD